MGGKKKYIEMFGSFMDPFKCMFLGRKRAPAVVEIKLRV